MPNYDQWISYVPEGYESYSQRELGNKTPGEGLEKIYEIPYTKYEDLTGECDFMGKSNADTVRDMFPESAIVRLFCLYTERLGVSPSRLAEASEDDMTLEKAENEIQTLIDQLMDYPSLDDEHMSELESEAIPEYVDDILAHDYPAISPEYLRNMVFTLWGNGSGRFEYEDFIIPREIHDKLKKANDALEEIDCGD